MEFFDPKEDVMDIQITRYGKYLLSKGLFKPMYYSFHDNDILYDDAYAKNGVGQEIQNNAELRITGSTPRLKAFGIYSGIETDVRRANNLVRFGETPSEDGKVLKVDREQLGSQKIQPTPEKSFTFANSIGTGGTRTNYVPSWSISFVQGEISSSTPYISSSTNAHEIMNIPQITSSLVYETFEISNEDFANFDDYSMDEATDLDVFPSLGETGLSLLDDGSPIFTRENSIILEIKEENTDITSENYNIEVFSVEKDSKTRQHILTPLSFIRKPTNIINGILVDDDEVEKLANTGIDESFVEYYLNVNVDCEIDFTKVSKDINKTRGIYLSGLPCLKVPTLPDAAKVVDPYGSIKSEDVEDCD